MKKVLLMVTHSKIVRLKTMHNLKLTTDELFDIVEILKLYIQTDNKLISIYEKFASQIPKNNQKPNYDYDIPDYNPTSKNYES